MRNSTAKRLRRLLATDMKNPESKKQYRTLKAEFSATPKPERQKLLKDLELSKTVHRVAAGETEPLTT